MSPLLSGVGRENLTAETARSVQLALAERILARRTITGIDVDRGIRYLQGAEKYDRAGTLYAMVLSSYLEASSEENPLPQVLSMWLGTLPQQMSASIKALIRALQLRLVDRRGGDASQYVTEIDSLIRSDSKIPAAPIDALGYVFAAMTAGPTRSGTSGVVSIRLTRMAILHFEGLHLPDGEAIPEELTRAVYGSVWLGAVAARTPAAVQEWLSLLSSLSRDQLARSIDSEEFARSAMYFTPRALVMEEEKREEPRDWLGIERVLIEIEGVGASVGFPLLAASACAARIVLLAEHRKDVDAAVRVAHQALDAYSTDRDAEFVLREALGTQLVAAKRHTQALVELERAVAINFEIAPVSCINAFVHLSVLTRRDSVERSILFARQAVALAKKDGELPRSTVIGVLAELAIALGDAQGVVAAFDPWSEGVAEVLAEEPQNDFDKGVYVRFAHCLGYYMSLAKTGRPPSGLMDGSEYVAPMPGLFLRNAPPAAAMYYPGLRPLIAAHMGMYADAIGDSVAAINWSRRAAELVDHNVSQDTLALLILTVLPFQLLSGAFEKAIASGVNTGLVLVRKVGEAAVKHTPQEEINTRKRAESLGRTFALLPAYLRVATLKLEGSTSALAEAQELVRICRERARQSGDDGWELAASIVEKSLVQVVERKELLRLDVTVGEKGDEQLREMARIATSLHPDTTPRDAIAVHFPVFCRYQTMGVGREGGMVSRMIVLPFLSVYWRNAVERSGFQFVAPRLFKTSIEDASAQGGDAGIRALFRSILDALSIRVPDHAREWLRKL